MAHQCHAVQDAQPSRPQPKTAGVKEIMEAHPYVNMDPQQQVHMYRVSFWDSKDWLLDSLLSHEWLSVLYRFTGRALLGSSCGSSQ